MRSNASLTGVPVIFDAIAASITWVQALPLLPKPPPTKGHSTRIFSGAMPKVLAAVLRTPEMFWLESYKVSSSPLQAAMVAWGSIGLWVSMGVVYMASMRVPDSLKAPTGLPRTVSVFSPGRRGGGVRSDFFAACMPSTAGLLA